MIGVGAGSALLRIDGRLLAIQDDAFRASWIALPTLDVVPFVLAGDGLALAKRCKPDFEAAVRAPDGAVYVLGSGSLPNRCTVARFDLGRSTVSLRDRRELYRSVRDALELRTRPNIEGALVDDDRLRLFHRGAGRRPSASIDVPLDTLERNATFHAFAMQAFYLGKLDGVPLAFTDVAALGQRRSAYVAAAEQTDDAIADGAVAGSALGLIERDGLRTRARWTRLLDSDGRPSRDKVEGLVLDDDLRAGWMLTDSDDARVPAVLGRLALEGFAA